MKKMWLLTVPTLLSVLLVAIVHAGPRLTIPETVFNFGYCPQNSDVSHRFTLVSTGDEPLQIMQIIPGCSCTRAPLEKERIEVGDSTSVEIIFSTRSYLDRVTKTPAIKTNEGPPDQKLQILATMISKLDSTYPLIIQPYILDLSQKTEKTIDRIEFGIRNVSDQDIRIELVSVASDYFSVDLPKSIKPGELAKGKLLLNKAALVKSFTKSFTIQCSDDDGSRFTIPVKRTFGGNFQPSTAGK